MEKQSRQQTFFIIVFIKEMSTSTYSYNVYFCFIQNVLSRDTTALYRI